MKAELARLHDALAGHVSRGELPGALTLIARRGEVHVDAVGVQRMGGDEPMRRNTIFRVSSMTKPVGAVAAMILVEDGKLRLDEPVDRLLPELANRRVLSRIDGPLDDTVPAKRSITLRDLLAFRMGFGLIWGPQDGYPIQRAANELELGAFGPPKPQVPPAPDEWMRRFSSLPLMHQPGERWMYNTGAEVLSVLIARASGQSLGAFLRQRVFEPLGMNDTGFSVPASKLDRFATSYIANPATKALDLYDEAAGGQWSREPAFPSAAAGLVSTVDDWYAFAQMLLDKGGFGRTRILSPESVAAITTDQITAEQKARSTSSLDPSFWQSRGWGFGISTVTGPGPKRYGWDGGLGTSWYSAPEQEWVAVLMTQLGAYPQMSPVYLDFWRAALQTIAD